MAGGRTSWEFTAELNERVCDYVRMPQEALEKTSVRDTLVADILPYVEKIARGLARRSTDPVDDIIQVGSIGLMKALEKYDPNAGTTFKTYATYLITGEIRHYLRDKSGMIKAPRQIYELYYRMNQIIQELSDELQRTPTDEEIALRLECPVEKVVQAQEVDRRRHMVSLDQFLTQDGNNSETIYVEKLVDEKYHLVSQARENNITLESALSALKDEFRDVVQMTYFEDMSQTEIAKELGISQMQVSRRLRKALSLLGNSLGEDAIDLKAN